MEKTLFKVPQMDCAAEENPVQVKLDGIGAARGLKLSKSVKGSYELWTVRT